ncbi:hypothetical protein FRC09_014205 [Ceratobasidium sp. 395]|nr:hypothetical protein FRC09_014205 [Ceratobasidium sp. 395]
MAERSADMRCGRTSMHMADEDSYGSDSESKLELNMPTDVVVTRHRKEIHHQCIESEQRCRHDLREGFARLEDVLPVSNQKGSKMALLDRLPRPGIYHLKYPVPDRNKSRPISRGDAAVDAVQAYQSEMEVTRLRQINEALMLKATERRPSQSPL